MATGTPRRTQAERREATRTALLEAAMECLVRDGYANLTTRRIAEVAGVSQGTQQHYFKTKAEFVVEAMRYAARQMAAEALTRIDVSDLRDPARQEALLDELWAVHRSPAFEAAQELMTAARTDEVLRLSMRDVEREISGTIAAIARRALPDVERDANLRDMIDIGLATMRGYALLAPVMTKAELDRRWARTRGHLLGTLQART